MRRPALAWQRDRNLFPVNVWPPLVDALTLVAAVFVLTVVVALGVQRGIIAKLRAREAEVAHLKVDKARVEEQLVAATVTGGQPSSLILEEGRVILQGELLFDTGSDAIQPKGRAALTELAGTIAPWLHDHPAEMVLVGGHTDDVPISNDRFRSNWELSAARATAVARALTEAGLDASRVVASGFGEYHPRARGSAEHARAQNRRIEVQLVPIRVVSSR